MTIEEVFKKIASHQIKGMMIHEQLANYYDFLGLCGYKRCHEYHFIEETLSYRSVCRYYISHHNKFIEEEQIENPNVIPSSWYKYTRQDVDNNTKRNAVKEGLDIWLKWEKETKSLYEMLYKEVINLDYISDSCKIKELINSVNEELKKIEKYSLNKKAIDYNLNTIISEQDKKHKKYIKKINKLFI